VKPFSTIMCSKPETVTVTVDFLKRSYPSIKLDAVTSH